MAILIMLPMLARTGADGRFSEPAHTLGRTTAHAAADTIQQVQFVFVAAEASRVALVGDFNNWDPDANPLRRIGAEGMWTAVIPLRSGRYLYAFLVDGTDWVADAAAPRGPEDAFGRNSVILVGENL